MTGFEQYPRLTKNLYKRPSDYSGETFEGTATLAGVHRDSDSVTRSNWRVLESEFKDNFGVIITRASHWAVGWVDSMRVQPDASDETKARCEEVLQQLEDYPVLNEDDLSELECDEIGEAVTDYLLPDFQRICGLTDEAIEAKDSELQAALGEAAEHTGESPHISDYKYREIAREIFGADLRANQEPGIVWIRLKSRGKAGTNDRKPYPLDGNWNWFSEYEKAYTRDDTGESTEWCENDWQAYQQARAKWGKKLFIEK